MGRTGSRCLGCDGPWRWVALRQPNFTCFHLCTSLARFHYIEVYYCSCDRCRDDRIKELNSIKRCTVRSGGSSSTRRFPSLHSTNSPQAPRYSLPTNVTPGTSTSTAKRHMCSPTCATTTTPAAVAVCTSQPRPLAAYAKEKCYFRMVTTPLPHVRHLYSSMALTNHKPSK